MLNMIVDPLKVGVPTANICEKTKTSDLSICELRYSKGGGAGGKVLSRDDLNKMRIGELRALLSDLGGTCQGCTDKAEYVAKVEALQNAKKGADKKEL